MREVRLPVAGPSFDVVTMGSATQDVFAKSDAETVTYTRHGDKETLIAYPLGSKILIEKLDFFIGGGGTNSATTFSRQGLRTGFIGKLGKDAPGLAVFRFLKEEGIEFLGAVGGQTGYSVILDSTEEDRTILTFKGANDQLKEWEIAETLAGLSARWLYCSSMLNESYGTMKRVMLRVKGQGGSVAFNPSAYQAGQGLAGLAEVLRLLDVLILNKEEAQLLTGKRAEARELLPLLRDAGPRIVIVTDGAKSATLLDGEHLLFIKPLPDLKVVETTGAGDAFGSGFVAGLARGLDTRQALLLAMLNAEHVITEYGAKNHILTKEEADRCLAEDRRQLVEEHQGRTGKSYK